MEIIENRDAAASNADAAKWVVGLSTAVFAGVFLHPEQIVRRTEWERVCFAVILLLFGISIVCGILYLFWLNWGRRQREKLREIDRDIAVEKRDGISPVLWAAKPESGGPAKEPETLKEKSKPVKDTAKPVDKTNWFYHAFITFFCFAAGLGVLAFCGSMVWPLESAPKPGTPDARTVPERYVIAQSAVHRTKGGMQAHTFLLNRETGDVWQMVCDRKGDVVSFRKVPRLDGNGKLEAEVSKAASLP